MKQTNIQFSFDEEKLEAVTLFLKQRDTELETELCDFMESLYKKNVPANVRGYIELRTQDSQPKLPKSSKKAVKPVKADCTGIDLTGINTREEE